MRTLTIIVVLGTLASAGTASAAGGGAVSATLTPNNASAASSASVAITGVGGNSGLPSSIDLVLQPGFTSSALSVPVLCTASQASSNSCPSASQIGTASAAATYLLVPLTGSLNVFLGDPVSAGDIASVIMSGSLYGMNLSLSGRLLVPAQGGLELLISSFPSLPITLDSLSLNVGATQTSNRTVGTTVIKYRWVTTGKGKHKRRHKKTIKKRVKKTITTQYSLIGNPPTCTGSWAGTATLTYASGADTLPFSMPCS